MNRVFVIFVLITVATLANYLLSLLVSRRLKRKALMPERLLISSIDEANKLRWKSKLSTGETAQIWADAMNIVMTAESEEVALQYIDQAAKSLGDEGAAFKEEALRILKMRFNSALEVH